MKAERLMRCIDRSRPELAMVKTAEELVAHLAKPPRPRFRFEYERKSEILAFLQKHYEAWRKFDTRKADRLCSLTIEQAQGPRALATIPELGKAWWATGDGKYGAAFERFYREVPTGKMFNWHEFNGLQAAIELDAFFLLLDCPQFTTEGRIAYLDHLHAITADAWDTHTSRWQQLTLGPEGHNWYLHGMHVLPLFGLLFPEFKRSEFFLRTGWSVVEEHVRAHFKADGGARETCMGYQTYSMCNLWDFYLVARRNGHPVLERYVETVLNGTKFLLRLMTPQGGMPSYGDSEHSAGGYTQLAAIAAAATGDRECKWYAEYCRRQNCGGKKETEGQIPSCAFWDVGLEGAATYDSIRAKNPHPVSVLMGPTGYAAMRGSGSPDACYMAVAAADRGPIVTSHGHNDVFSLEVHAAGVRFVGEEGCAPYGTSAGRMYDESTEAHSTLTIKGMEQAPILSEWRWDGRVIPCVRRWISEDTHDFFHGVHEGFYHYGRHETLHARKIFFIKTPPSYWIVLDWVESSVKNEYRILYHGCVPGSIKGSTVILGDEGKPRLAIIQPGPDPLKVERIRSKGLAAYTREKNLDAERYPCFMFSKKAASDCFVSAIIPLAKGESAPKIGNLPVSVNGIAEDAHGASAVEISFSTHVDVLCVSHKDFDADLEFGPHRAWGHLAFRRLNKAGKTELSIEHTMADGICGR